MGATEKFLEKANEIYKEYLTMSVNFGNLEKTFDKFTDRMERHVKELKDENEELRRRITKLEGMVDATFQKSMERALVTVVQEHLEKHGAVAPIQIGDLTGGLSLQSEQALPPSTDEQPEG